jgi:ribose 5-phosphate isomerase B
MKIAIAADHAGYALKQCLFQDLQSQGVDIEDLGAHQLEPQDDYPDFAERVGKTIGEGGMQRGIIVCGSGVGVCVAVNKFPGVRAGICHDTYSARQGVEHDNMNVLCIGSRIIGPALAREIVQAFVQAGFSGGERHQRRLQKVLNIEKRCLRSKG